MKLTADTPFGPAVAQVLKGPLEAPQRPIQRHFWILFHACYRCLPKFHAWLSLHRMARRCPGVMWADGTPANKFERGRSARVTGSRSVCGILVGPCGPSRLACRRLGPLHGARGVPQPASSRDQNQSGGAARQPTRHPGRVRRAGWWRWGGVPAPGAAFVGGHPASQEDKRIGRTDRTPICRVKLLTIQTQPRAAKLHASSL